MKITLADIQPHLSFCRDTLNASNAALTGDSQSEAVGIALNKEGAVRRVWGGFSAKDVYRLQAYLMFYTDASNGKPSSWVKDPVVGAGHRAPMIPPGVYRNAYVIVRQTGNDTYQLIQELRLGFIRELVTGGNVDWSEARVEQQDWYNGNATHDQKRDFVVVKWTGVDPQKCHDIAESLKAVSGTISPVVEGQTLGSYKRRFIRTREEQDGSHTILMLVANSRITFDSYESNRRWFSKADSKLTYHFGVPEDEVAAVLILEAGAGKSAHVSDPDQQGLCSIVVRGPADGDTQKEELEELRTSINCAQDTYLDAYWGLTKAEAQAINLPTTAVIGTTHTMDRRPNGDGTWDVIVRRVVSKVQSRTEDVAQDTWANKVLENQYVSLHPENLSDPPVMDEAFRGKTWERQIRINEDCTLDVRENTDEIKDQPSEAHNLSHAETVTVSGNTAAAAPLDPVLEAPLSQGTIVQLSSTETRYGKYQNQREQREAIDQEGGSEQHAAGFTESTDTHTHLDAPPVVATTPDEGHLLSAEYRPTPHGTYQTRLTDRESREIEVAEYVSLQSAGEERTAKHGSNIRTANLTGYEAAETPAQGETEQVRFRRNQDGTYEVDYDKREAKKLEVAEYTSLRQYDQTVATKRGENLKDADVAADYALPAQDVGTTHRQTIQKAQDGTLSVNQEQIVAINQTSISKHRSASLKEDTDLDTATDTIPGVSETPEQGLTIIQQVQPRPDGLNRVQRSERESIKLEQAEYQSLLSYAETRHHKTGENLRDADVTEGYDLPSATEGQTVTQRRQRLPDGTFRIEQERNVAVNQVITQETDAAGYSESSETNTAVATDSLPTSPPVADPGETKTVILEPQPHGKVRVTERSRNAKELYDGASAGTEYQSMDSEGENRHVLSGRGLEVPIDIGEAGEREVRTLQLQRADDGSWTGRRERIVTVDQEGSSYREHAGEVEEVNSHTAALTALEPPLSVDDEVVVRQTSIPNRDGSFRTEESTTTYRKLEVSSYNSENNKDRTVAVISGRNLKDEDLTPYAISAEEDPGVRSQVSRARDGNGLYQASKQTETLRESQDIDITIPGPDGDIFYKRRRNAPAGTAAAIVSGLSSGRRNNVSIEPGPAGLESYTITSSPNAVSGGGGDGGWNNEYMTWRVIEGDIYYKRCQGTRSQVQSYLNANLTWTVRAQVGFHGRNRYSATLGRVGDYPEDS